MKTIPKPNAPRYSSPVTPNTPRGRRPKRPSPGLEFERVTENHVYRLIIETDSDYGLVLIDEDGGPDHLRRTPIGGEREVRDLIGLLVDALVVLARRSNGGSR